MLIKTPINHLFKSPFSKWQPLVLTIIVNAKSILQMHCKRYCYLILEIKYLDPSYVKPLCRAYREHSVLFKTPITRLFQSPLSNWQPLQLTIIVNAKSIVKMHCKIYCYLIVEIKYLDPKYVKAYIGPNVHPQF